MNSTQRLIAEILGAGPRQAIELLAALRLKGKKLEIEDLYVELVAMEAGGLARVEPVHMAGQVVAKNWAVGRNRPPPAPAATPELRNDWLGRPIAPTSPPAAGSLVHRCL